MSSLFCIGLLAQLEGYKNLELPSSYEGEITLAHLDIRTRALENHSKIATPPAVLDPTWESLVWRLRRLERWIGGSLTTIDPVSTSHNLFPTQASPSLEKLKTVVFSIPYPQGCLAQPQYREDVEDEAISVMLQRVCHVAGRRGYKFLNIPRDRMQLWNAAVLVSIELEVPRSCRPPPPGFPSPPWPSRPQQKLACCGCCSCACHRSFKNKTDKSEGSVSDASCREKQSLVKKLLQFAWLRKLVCWRKKKDWDSDSSSSHV